ncbi:Hypothetical predicted protein [Mytilus galloprovincialis]|uniref:DUF5641 domain-containing protein n=1 Tax=Mytilus galloprovincialis TaxID=29158 RepID=A0A8B6FXN5_MYTGA|nr:Hypothetical predicted protein [Mytilus galloprovincialis]
MHLKKAVAAVAYIRTTEKDGSTHLGFVLGKAKVAPKHGHTIPRLELCAAVLAVELYETICEELKTEFQQVQFFTDSKVELGYIHNETKRFYLYVGNRVDRIRRSTKPEQWSYVPTLQNPADDASRSIRPEKLNQSQWLIGPTQFLCKKNTIDSETEGDEFPLILPEEDRDVRVAKTLLDPFIDENGLLRAGGRLSNANIFPNELKPLIIAKHHIATLLKRHFHEKVAHQGRHLTEGALRSAGYWLIGGKGLISSVIHKCIKCKLRGKEEFPKMADLPFDRLDPAPPFSYVGIDVFGPWTITTRRTRGGQAQSKRWAVNVHLSCEDFCDKDLLKSQWRCVQQLANSFWKRWRTQYLPTLQMRHKWKQECRNLTEGDIVLMRDASLHRNDWPIGVIEQTYASSDGRVREVQVRLGKNRKLFTRPANEVVFVMCMCRSLYEVDLVVSFNSAILPTVLGIGWHSVCPPNNTIRLCSAVIATDGGIGGNVVSLKL